jgi:formamidopyrimidine-DNA glycosylase
VPELPEVETIRARLAPALVGRRIEHVEIADVRLTRPDPPEAVAAALKGERIADVGRRGKYLVFAFESGRHLLVHLRMTGNLQYPAEGGLAADPYRRAVVRLDDGSEVAYRDVRRFGTWTLLEPGDAEEYLAERRLGLEPLERGFTATSLEHVFAGRRAPVKAALLDQRAAAGIGNIYADEALHIAALHPLSPAGSMKTDHAEALRAGIVTALQAGLENGGASMDDYLDARGERGSMQDEFLVHTREGESCPRCGETIRRIVVSGRSTYFCPACQKRLRRRRRRQVISSRGR